MCDNAETKRMRSMPGLVRAARNKLLQKMRVLRVHSIEAQVRRAVSKMCRCL